MSEILPFELFNFRTAIFDSLGQRNSNIFDVVISALNLRKATGKKFLVVAFLKRSS
ncbi:MAG TPA: hypothetical protein VFF30_07105 [Nitrososphaerales archaeon]|nr:hypothetical protein [Nitrososphaerales archaeon]